MGRLPRTRLRTIDWRAARRAARAALDELDVDVDPRMRVGDLSVELQQEVEIARAISTDFRVLVLDEATSSLSEAATRGSSPNSRSCAGEARDPLHLASACASSTNAPTRRRSCATAPRG